MPDVIAIIPARGGSKGIPGKNIRIVGGKPLIAWTIEVAQKASSVQRVIVSTDSSEIADIAKEYGAEVVLRPIEISGDTASSEEALIHVLGHLKVVEKHLPDLVVFLQCSSPLTSSEDIEGAVKVLQSEEADSALAVTPFHYFLWNKTEKGEVKGINHDKNVRQMRQQRQPQFLETGAVYVMRVDGFLKAKHRFFGKTALYIMPPERCLEIDDMNDLLIAEERLRGRQHQGNVLPADIGAIVFDFDGVFTDNRVIIHENGSESVLCHRGDGLGLSQLRELGIPMLVLSTETNSVVQKRCAKLKIECRQGCKDKLEELRSWLDTRGCRMNTVIYVGNDINDIECLNAVGYPVVVADAHPSVRRVAFHILNSSGGFGAIRELSDIIVRGYNAHKKSV